MKPNSVGPKILYLNATEDSFTTAELAAIDTTNAPAAVNYSPYAYSATLRSDYDAFRPYISAQSLAAVNRVCFGLFLSPDNDKRNLLFQLTGRARLHMADTTECGINLSFFFGRKATNNTIVSSKAGVNNTLETIQHLPLTVCMASYEPIVAGTTNRIYRDISINSELFSLYSSGKYVYCFGVEIRNTTSSSQTITFDASLAFRKYSSAIEVYNPERI